MQEFNVSLTDKPGELAEVASAVGDQGINILGCVGMGRSQASVTMVTDDEAATSKVLESMGRPFETNELIITTLPNKPGSLAEMAGNLSKANVNIISFFMCDQVGHLEDLSSFVKLYWLEPSAFITHMQFSPLLLDTNAILSPSGDQEGL